MCCGLVVVAIVVVIVVDVVIIGVVVVVVVVGGVAGRASATTRRLSSGHQDGLELQRLPGVAPRRVVGKQKQETRPASQRGAAARVRRIAAFMQGEK